MRILRACLAASALVAAGGCLGDGGSVMVTFDSQSGVTPAITGFTATNATGTESSDHFVHFTATSPQGTLTMLLSSPLSAGQMADLTMDHNFVSYDITGAGWGSNGGTVAVDSISPYKVRFLSVPMLPGSGSAKGDFVLNGSGTYK
jgi:hypothetical protein